MRLMPIVLAVTMATAAWGQKVTYNFSQQADFSKFHTYKWVQIPEGEKLDDLTRNQIMRLSIEFIDSRPVSVQFPDTLEVRIADTAPPTHGQTDSNWKPAELDNGIEIMVPQFIKTGDVVRLDVAQLKYMDRAKGAGSRG